MQYDYEKLLDSAREKLPESVLKSERFEIPKIIGHVEGNKTILSNFLPITQYLGRAPEHVLKYVLKELATPGGIKKNVAILGRKLASSIINDKIKQYAREFVLCPECGKPDTKLEKEGNITYMKCTACGSRNAIKSRI